MLDTKKLVEKYKVEEADLKELIASHDGLLNQLIEKKASELATNYGVEIEKYKANEVELKTKYDGLNKDFALSQEKIKGLELQAKLNISNGVKSETPVNLMEKIFPYKK